MDAKLINESIDFYNQGNSMSSTCKKFHTTSGTLKKIFKERNIYIRNRSEQCVLENIKRTKDINHFYFDTVNNENSYYLGFLAADGTVRKDRNEIKVGLSKVDKEFLINFKNKLQSEKEVKDYITTKGFEVSEFCFSSLNIKTQLAKYGIVPNKTYKGLDLNLIPELFKLPFIKGFFDGDGSIVYNKNTKQVKISFTSHTKEFLKQINEYFENQGHIYRDKRSDVYELEFSTNPSLRILYLFYETIKSPCLARKYNKYLEILELRNKNPRDKDAS